MARGLSTALRRVRGHVLSGRFSALWVLGWATFTAPTSALDPARPLHEYSIAGWTEGLPQQTIHSIVQTPEGYLWLATYEGLARFDGNRFVIFDRESTPAVQSNTVYDLIVSEDGSLWIGTAAGLSRRARDGSFEAVLTPGDVGGEAVTTLFESPGRGIWVGSGRSLHRLENGRIVETLGAEAGLPDSVIRSLLVDAADRVWIGFESGDLVHLDGRIPVSHAVAPPSRAILALAEGEDGELWVGTEGAGVFRGRDGVWTSFARAEGLSNDWIRALWIDEAADGSSSIWIGTEGGGLNRWREGEVEVIDTTTGLSADLVRSLWMDTEGSLWIGTNGGGVQVLRDQKFSAYDQADGLSHRNVRTVMEDRQGNLWVGSDGGGLVRFRDGEIDRRWRRGRGLRSDLVKALYESRDGALWVGTTGGGVTRIGEDGASETYGIRDGLPAEVVYSLIEDDAGGLWVGTNRGLAYRADEDDEFTAVRAVDGLHNENVTALARGPEGALWFGTLGGLHRRERNGGLRVYDETSGLPSPRVLALAHDDDGRLWVGSDRGLARWEPSTDRFVAYGASDGLPHERIFTILDDGHGALWTSSNRGVMKVAKSDLERRDRGELQVIPSETFDRSDGLPADQCNGTSQPAAWRGRDGRLWFATVGGAAVVDPSNLRRNETPPPVTIESFVVDSVAAEISDRVRVPPEGRSLEINYTALSFLSPGNLRFRYRLLGLDDSWTEAGNRRTAYFMNLPPGEYRFQVTAENEDGVTHPVGASVPVTVEPHLYEERWFQLAALGFLFVLPWLAYLARSRRAVANRRRLEQQVAARTEELAEANRRLERQSRLDGLTGVANRRRLDEWLDDEWRRAQRHGSPLALLMVDIDSFKEYNDLYGHVEGDECLRRVATALSDGARRAGDRVARYGGEEFAVILSEMEREAALDLAESLRSRVRELRISHDRAAVPPYLTVSVGVAWGVPDRELVPADLVTAADEALYEAKREGRNRVAAKDLDAV